MSFVLDVFFLEGISKKLFLKTEFFLWGSFCENEFFCENIENKDVSLWKENDFKKMRGLVLKVIPF